MIQWSARLAVILSLLVVAPGLSAQEGIPGYEPVYPTPRAMIGFVANAPDELLGAGAAWLPSFLDGWGVYVDYKWDASSPENESNFLATMTGEEAQQGGDEQRLDRNSYRTANLALVRAFRADLVVYLGAGVTDETVFSEFFDETLEMGELGHYWVKYSEIGGLRPNFLGGVFFRLARHITAQFGAEALPSGFTVGVHFTL